MRHGKLDVSPAPGVMIDISLLFRKPEDKWTRFKMWFLSVLGRKKSASQYLLPSREGKEFLQTVAGDFKNAINVYLCLEEGHVLDTSLVATYPYRDIVMFQTTSLLIRDMWMNNIHLYFSEIAARRKFVHDGVVWFVSWEECHRRMKKL
jgi:hypothetical protein